MYHSSKDESGSAWLELAEAYEGPKNATMGRPESYTIERPKSCCNCKHVCNTEHADGNKYYCHQDKSERPPNAVQRGGSIRQRLALAWFTWANPRRVNPLGVCDEFEEQESTS